MSEQEQHPAQVDFGFYPDSTLKVVHPSPRDSKKFHIVKAEAPPTHRALQMGQTPVDLVGCSGFPSTMCGQYSRPSRKRTPSATTTTTL